jgi:hypothetical protein
VKKGKPKQAKVYWPDPAPDAKPHERNWFRSLDSKKLKGEARKRKFAALLDSLH